MASLSHLVDAISNRCGLNNADVRQCARRLREDRQLVSANIEPVHVALLLLAAMTAGEIKNATKRACTFAGLSFDGQTCVDDFDDQPTTLLRHLTAVIESAWYGRGEPSFVELVVDLSVPAAATKLEWRGVTMSLDFVLPGENADCWSTRKIRREARLPGAAFYAIIADLRHADRPISRMTVPLRVTQIGGRNV